MCRHISVIMLAALLAVTSVHAQQFEMAVDMKLAEGASVPTKQDLLAISAGIGHRIESGATISRIDTDDIVPADASGRTAVWRMIVTVQVLEDKVPHEDNLKFRAAVADQLKRLATSDSQLNPEQRAARLAEVNGQLATFTAKLEAVETLANARGDSGKALQARLAHLRETLQQLEIQLAAKQARQAALRGGLDRQRRQGQIQAQEDAIINELRKLVKLREESLARSKQLRDQGLTAVSEFGRAEAELAEAKIRLAEREATLAKGGKGDLLERLSDELAMVSIDLMELDIQISQVRDQLKRYDISVANPKQLEELLANDPQLAGANLASLVPLKEDLRRQSMQLVKEKFALLVDDVTLQEVAKQ
jgi:hypothetical protein